MEENMCVCVYVCITYMCIIYIYRVCLENV